MGAIPVPGITIADSERAYAYAEGDLADELSKSARSGSFTAIIANPRSKRPLIVAIIDHDQAIALARRARARHEDALWHASAPGLSA